MVKTFSILLFSYTINAKLYLQYGHLVRSSKKTFKSEFLFANISREGWKNIMV